MYAGRVERVPTSMRTGLQTTAGYKGPILFSHTLASNSESAPSKTPKDPKIPRFHFLELNRLSYTFFYSKVCPASHATVIVAIFLNIDDYGEVEFYLPAKISKKY